MPPTWAVGPCGACPLIFNSPDESQTGPIGINVAKHWCLPLVLTRTVCLLRRAWKVLCVLNPDQRKKVACGFAAPFLQVTDALHGSTAAARHHRQLSNDLLESFSKLNIMDTCFWPSYSWGENEQLWRSRRLRSAATSFAAFFGRRVRWLVSSDWSESSWPLRPRASTVTSVSPTTARPSWACWGWPTPWPSREVKTTSTATRSLRWLDHAWRRLWCLQVSGEL